LSEDYENKMKMLQQSVTDNEEKLKEARRKELDFMQKEQQLKRKEEELELSVQKKLIEERERLTTEIRKIEDQKKVTHITSVEIFKTNKRIFCLRFILFLFFLFSWRFIYLKILPWLNFLPLCSPSQRKY